MQKKKDAQFLASLKKISQKTFRLFQSSWNSTSRKNMTIHKMMGSREYLAWRRMKSWCLNPNHPSYKTYGAQGVTFCKEWDEFKEFYQDMGEITHKCNG